MTTSIRVLLASNFLLRKRHLVLICMPLLLSACAVQSPQSASVPPNSLSTPTRAAVVRFSFGDMSWVMPASWNKVIPKIWTAPVGPLLFLSNAQIVDPCASTYRGTECWKPLTKLPADGILVTFEGSAIIQVESLALVFVELAVSRNCQDMGGRREIATYSHGLGIDACLRGPDFAANVAKFKELVSTQHRKSALTDKEYAFARELVRSEIRKEGAVLTSATVTVGYGRVFDSNVGYPCRSGRLLHIKLIGEFPHITTGGLAVQPGAPLPDMTVHAVNLILDAKTGRPCLIGIQTGKVAPAPNALSLPIN
jgi:hypothetical protein